MANKIIKFKNTAQTTSVLAKKQNTEVYTDVSLVSMYIGSNALAKETYVDDVLLVDTNSDDKLNIDDSNSLLLKKHDNVDPKMSFKITRSINVKAVQNAIENIFNFIPGERVLYPEFGSTIRLYLYEGITIRNVENLIAEINKAFDLFDERVVVDDILDVSSILETDDNTVVLRIIYHIKDLPIEYYSYDYSYTRAID